MALPTVATDIPGTRDLVDGELGTLVPFGDAAALRSALVDLSSDPAAYERMSAAARAHAETYHLGEGRRAVRAPLRGRGRGAGLSGCGWPGRAAWPKFPPAF